MTMKSFLPIGIGSLPHQDPDRASQLILKYFPESPFWPQLPRRSFKESMLVQFAARMPGVVIEDDKIYFRLPFEPMAEWEKYYAATNEDLSEYYALDQEFASGFYSLLELLKIKKPLLIKGQVTGPVTFGLGVTDERRIPILYEPNLREMLLKIIASKARWQEREFKKVVPEAETLIFFDEPLLSGYGSISMNLSKEEIIALLQETVSNLQGLSGIHICGATDWSIVTQTKIKVIHFDAYQFFPNLLTYAPELKEFLLQGGFLAWGIVPADEEFIKKESSFTLKSSLEEKMELLIKEGIPEELLKKNSFISQSCGLSSLSLEMAEKGLQLSKELADLMLQAIA